MILSILIYSSLIVFFIKSSFLRACPEKANKLKIPIKFWKTIINVIRGFSETKTENKLRTFIKRKTFKSKEYTPYDSRRFFTVLFRNNPIYAYSESIYKSFLTVLNRHK